jgi:hypothetical protein
MLNPKNQPAGAPMHMYVALTAVVVHGTLWGLGSAGAATKLAPSEIQGTFFNGQPFTASTPSQIKFKMSFTPDGKVTREPVGKSGTKGQGTWNLNKDGFCTTWTGSKAACFTLISAGPNKWSVMRGPAPVAEWSK